MEAGGGNDSCDGKPLQKIWQSWKNLFLVVLLISSVSMIVAAYRCESHEAAATADKESEFCASRTYLHIASSTDSFVSLPAVIRTVTPRFLFYVGACLLSAWCCCPCFKLECDKDYVENRTCILRNVQRRRRAARRARLRAEGSALVDDVDELEP